MQLAKLRKCYVLEEYSPIEALYLGDFPKAQI